MELGELYLLIEDEVGLMGSKEGRRFELEQQRTGIPMWWTVILIHWWEQMG